MAQGGEPMAFRRLLLLPCPRLGTAELPWDSPRLSRRRCCSPGEGLGFWGLLLRLGVCSGWQRAGTGQL